MQWLITPKILLQLLNISKKLYIRKNNMEIVIIGAALIIFTLFNDFEIFKFISEYLLIIVVIVSFFSSFVFVTIGFYGIACIIIILTTPFIIFFVISTSQTSNNLINNKRSKLELYPLRRFQLACTDYELKPFISELAEECVAILFRQKINSSELAKVFNL